MGGSSVPSSTAQYQQVATGIWGSPQATKLALPILKPALANIKNQQDMLMGFQKGDPEQTRKFFGLPEGASTEEAVHSIAGHMQGPQIQSAAQPRAAAHGGIMNLEDEPASDPRKFAKGGLTAEQAKFLQDKLASGKKIGADWQKKLDAYNAANPSPEKSAISDAATAAGLTPSDAYLGRAGFFGGAYDPKTNQFSVTNPYYNQAINVLQGMNQQPAQFGQASDIYNQTAGRSWTDPGVAQSYMNPYIETALKSQEDLANRQFAQQQNQLRSQAAGRGAFGGSASALAEQAAQQNQNMTLKDLVAQGMNQAYSQGMGQFGNEQQQRLAAAGGLGSLGSAIGGYGSNLANLWGQAGGTLQGLGQNYFNQLQQNAGSVWGGPTSLANQGMGILGGMGGGQSGTQFQTTRQG